MKSVLAALTVASTIALGALALASAQSEAGNHPGHLQGMTGGMREMMGGGHMAERPLISLALQHKDQLDLAADQVRALESLRAEFQKEAIRRSADIESAELELAELLRPDSADLAQVEVKLRELERLRTDLRLSRIKTIEKGKALLTPEQRKKLEALGRRASAGSSGHTMAGRGADEMERFMSSERMPQAMAAMMGMARQMGNGDMMAGMVRMMEMMGTMGEMGGMMGPAQPQPSR